MLVFLVKQVPITRTLSCLLCLLLRSSAVASFIPRTICRMSTASRSRETGGRERGREREERMREGEREEGGKKEGGMEERGREGGYLCRTGY